jgi:hypothetical protein
MITHVNVSLKIPVWLDRLFTWPVIEYRRHKYGFPFRKIPLGDGFFTIVDSNDYYRFNKLHWSLRKYDRCIYAVRFINRPGQNTMISSLHREIMEQPKGLLVDHKNLNTLDNRRTNLRLATRSQNQFNRQKNKTKTLSRFIGVCLDKRRKKWFAYIKYETKRTWLGTFDNEIDAAKAYDMASKKYHGDFARLNFPERSEGPREVTSLAP